MMLHSLNDLCDAIFAQIIKNSSSTVVANMYKMDEIKKIHVGI